MQSNTPTITGILAQALSVRAMKYLQTHSRETPSHIGCIHSMNSYPHAYTRQDLFYLWQHQQTAACETPDSSAGEEAGTFHSAQNLCLAPKQLALTVFYNLFLCFCFVCWVWNFDLVCHPVKENQGHFMLWAHSLITSGCFWQTRSSSTSHPRALVCCGNQMYDANRSQP